VPSHIPPAVILSCNMLNNSYDSENKGRLLPQITLTRWNP